MAPASGGGLCDARAVEDPWEGAQHADGGSCDGGADGDSFPEGDDDDEDGDTTSEYDGGGSNTDVGGADDDVCGADDDCEEDDDDVVPGYGGGGDSIPDIVVTILDTSATDKKSSFRYCFIPLSMEYLRNNNRGIWCA